MSRQSRMAIASKTRYNESTATHLSDVYKTYSDRKFAAYHYCIGLMTKLNGFDFRIISHNVFMFTAGFKFVEPETGVVKFMYITPSYDEIVDY